MMKKVLCFFCVSALLLITGCGGSVDKAEDLYSNKDVDKNIAKAYQYFDDNAESAVLKSVIEISGNKESAEKTGLLSIKDETFSFEKSNTNDYAFRLTITGVDGSESIFYVDQSGGYLNAEETESGDIKTEKLKKIMENEMDRNGFIFSNDCSFINSCYYILDENASADQDIYIGAKKEQKVNKDGSIDITIHADTETLNAEAKAQYDYLFTQEYINELEEEYSAFLEKDVMIQKTLAERGTEIDYYPKQCYTTIHINSQGFISEMTEVVDKDTYANFANGVDGSYTLTKKTTISKLNKNKVKKDDVEF